METADYFKDLEKLGNPDKDEAFACSRKFVARLKRKNFQASHHDMNTLHVKTAKSRDTKLVRLPQPPFLKENNL